MKMPVSVQHVDVIAVRLDDVGLVNPVLLVIRPGVVDPLLATATAAIELRGIAQVAARPCAPQMYPPLIT
jgi:hypothetical protein